MKPSYLAKIAMTIGFLLVSAAAFTHAQEPVSGAVANVSNRGNRLLEVVPMMGPPAAFKNGQLLGQPNVAQVESGWTRDEQSRLCDQLEAGDATALATLQAEVSQQHAWAQRVMAMYYLDPRSPLVPPDRLRALQLYRDAGEQGDLSAQYTLGWMLLAGGPFGPNHTEARYWLEKAAAQGSSDAMTLLGAMLRDGKGGDRNLAAAVVQFRQAADHRNGHAFLDLAAAYANGEGVEADLVQAYMWAILASPKAGTGNFGKAVKSYMETLARKLQPPQIDEAKMLARAWQSLHPIRTVAMPPRRG